MKPFYRTVEGGLYRFAPRNWKRFLEAEEGSNPAEYGGKFLGSNVTVGYNGLNEEREQYKENSESEVNQ